MSPGSVEAWALAGFGLGAIAGSFLGTLAVRWPAGRGLGGRSRCDRCGRVLGPLELVPLLSAITQRGRCRGCRAPIGGDQFRIEAAAAAIGTAAFALQPGIAGAGWALLGWLLLTLAVLDIRHFWLPDRLTVPLLASGLLIGGLTTGVALIDRGIGAAAGFGALWAIGAGYRRWRGREGLGGGDPKLLAAIGGWLGWAALPFVLLAASVIGLGAAALAGGLARDRLLPFGAALAAGALPGWLVSAALLR